MGKDEINIFLRKESGKVLVMDNPFEQIGLTHLLKPLIKYSK